MACTSCKTFDCVVLVQGVSHQFVIGESFQGRLLNMHLTELGWPVVKA